MRQRSFGQRLRSQCVGLVAVAMLVGWGGSAARAQSFGIELHNTLMPISGAMGGASIAKPQEVTSAVNANPAALAQFEGTQFTFSGAWSEPTYNLSHFGGSLPNLGDFAAKSEAEGSALGNIGVAQDLRGSGVPATIGMSLLSQAGAGLSFRDVPASNGTSVAIAILQITSSVGVDLTERLSAGGSFMLGAGGLDAPFVGNGAQVTDYALRGTVGLDYDLGGGTTIGGYYQTRQRFNFDDAISFDLGGGNFSATSDIDLDLPENFGIGVANDALCCGKLLVAVDVLYKQWDRANLFKAIYEDQWVVQLGAQYEVHPRLRLRIGYAYAEDPLRDSVGNTAGGVTPPRGEEAIRYLQATLAINNQHRLSGGFGISDIMPGIDLDVMAGGMFESSAQLGEFTATSVESYWVGAGMTWKFGRAGGCNSCGNDGCDSCVQ